MLNTLWAEDSEEMNSSRGIFRNLAKIYKCNSLSVFKNRGLKYLCGTWVIVHAQRSEDNL